MDSSWDETQVKTLLNLLAPHPCLYDTYFAVYFTFEERQRLYEDICEKLRVVIPAVTVNQIKTKMKSLRRQFNQETKLVQEARERGKEYKPVLWCYDLLKFLQGRCEDNSPIAEAFIVITDSDGLSDAAENNHSQGNPTKKMKCGSNLSHQNVSSKINANAQESKANINAKRKRKIPKNERKYIQINKSDEKAVSSESAHDDNYEGDIEDATVRSDKMPRPNEMFLIKYFEALFSGELHNSNDEYLLNNTAGYSYFGVKHNSVIPTFSQIIENDHISCLTDGKEDMFEDQLDYEELSHEKVKSLTYFIEETNNHLAFEYLRGEYYIIDTSKHIIHSQGKKMNSRNKENRHETNFYHKYKHMNLSLPILKSARYVRLCSELVEDDSYAPDAETSGENLRTLSHCRTSGRSIRDILNASKHLETLDELNRNVCSGTKNMMQTSHQGTHAKRGQPVESCDVNYITHDKNGTGIFSPIQNEMIEESTTSHNHFEASVQVNMNECKIVDSESDEERMSNKNLSGMSQQIARDKYFFKKGSEDVTYDNCIVPIKDQQQNISPVPNWLQEKPHCSKSNINGYLEIQSSFDVCHKGKSTNEGTTLHNSTGYSFSHNDHTDAGAAANYVNTVQAHNFEEKKMNIDFRTLDPELALRMYARGDFFINALNDNVADQIPDQEVEDGNGYSDVENDAINRLSDDDDNQSEFKYDGFFNNSLVSQSESSSRQGSSKDSGNGDDSPCSFSSSENERQLWF